MPRTIFVDKLLKRLEKMDKEALQSYLIRLQNEKDQIEHILNQLPVGLFLIGKNLKIQWANSVAQTMFGSRIEPGRETPLKAVIADEQFLIWLENTLTEERGLYNEEFEVLFPRERCLIVTVRPLRDNGHELYGFLIAIVDITATRMREREANEIQRINTLLKLSKGIAHELGNPLNSISIHLKLLGKMSESVSAKERKKFEDTVEVLTQETARLDRIIKNFLKLTRQKPPVFKMDNIQDVLEESLRFFAPKMKEDKIKTKTDYAKNIPPFLMDRDKMHQAFLNIIKNAVEAMPKGGELRVKAAIREKVCTIAFQDTGIGIAEKNLNHIFEDYYTTKEEGSGLGLAIVYNIIREHGGRIDVKSSAGKGTFIIIYLPVRTNKLQLPEKSS